MAVTAEVSKSKVILRYDKKGSSSYTIDSEISNDTLYNVATEINSLQTTQVSGIFKTVEQELVPQE